MTDQITMRLTRPVIQDPDDANELLLDLGQELCETMGWQAGDVMEWTDNGDGSWTLSKKS
jgi:hypothetical protein